MYQCGCSSGQRAGEPRGYHLPVRARLSAAHVTCLGVQKNTQHLLPVAEFYSCSLMYIILVGKRSKKVVMHYFFLVEEKNGQTEWMMCIHPGCAHF